jgi:hypothetical protein
MSIRAKKVHINRADVREINEQEMKEALPTNQDTYGGGQTAYGGGQTAYDAGKTPMAVNTPNYFPGTPGYNDGGANPWTTGGTGGHDAYN